MADEDLPASIKGNFVYFRPQHLTRGKLVLRRVRGTDDRATQSKSSGIPRDSLSHIARARGPHPLGQVLPTCQGNGVCRSSRFERADGLQVFELQVDPSIGLGVERNERRPQGRSRNPRNGLPDFIERRSLKRHQARRYFPSRSGVQLFPSWEFSIRKSYVPSELN